MTPTVVIAVVVVITTIGIVTSQLGHNDFPKHSAITADQTEWNSLPTLRESFFFANLHLKSDLSFLLPSLDSSEVDTKRGYIFASSSCSIGILRVRDDGTRGMRFGSAGASETFAGAEKRHQMCVYTRS